MVLPQRLFSNSEGLSGKPFSLSVVSLGVIVFGQIVGHLGDRWMLGTKRLFIDCQSPLEERFRPAVVTSCRANRAQQIQRRRNLRMVLPQGFFAKIKRVLGQRLGFLICARWIEPQRL